MCIRDSLQGLLRRAGAFGEKRPVAVVVVFALFGVIGLIGVSRVSVDTNMVEVIREGLPIRTAHDVVDRVMGGTQGMEIYAEFGEPEAMQDPIVLKTLDAMQDQLERDYPDFVVRTNSLTLAAKRSYRVLNEDQPSYYTIPDDRDALAQTCLLYTSPSPRDATLSRMPSSA